MDAFFHYRFITFKSYFPFIKEDLVKCIVIRASLGMSVWSMLPRFYLKLPITYFVCAGQNRPSDTVESVKCAQSSIDVAEAVFRSIMAMTYLVFSILIIYEKTKLKRADAIACKTSLGAAIAEKKKRLGVILEVGLFLGKITLAIFNLLIMKVYNESDTEYLINTALGRILVYGNQLFSVPVGYLVLFVYKYAKDKGFRSYMNRCLSCWL